MLRYLNIQNFVIVDRMELDFRPGFTVLTGETGAGKSILIDALSLVLGERGDAGVVRAQCERAELVAEFDVGQLSSAQAWLKENDLEGEAGQCMLRRIIDAGGRSRGFINGHPATLQQMRAIGEMLLDIHGQHAHQSLLRADTQRVLVDAYAGLTALVDETAEAWRRWQDIRRNRIEWENNASQLEAEREELEWKIQELSGLNLSENEWQELQIEHGRLGHAASLVEAAEVGLAALDESEGAALARINALVSRLRGLQEFDPALKEILDVLEPAGIQLQETVYALRHYRQRVELDPDRLQEVERRVEAIHGAARKYRAAPEDLPRLLDGLQARLEEIRAVIDVDKMAREEASAREAYYKVAARLSDGRARAVAELSRRVTDAMQNLAMAGGVFEAALLKKDEGGLHGLEQVEFRVSSHPGLSLGPLGKVASGGELSRISLAIQVVVSKVASVPTLIFDEVDTGIGGKVAEIVGRMLRQLGREYQVMCVTHLPQVAAAGDQHWRVVKDAEKGAVSSSIAILDADHRIEEIARMLGGVRITQTTLKHAAEMLGASQEPGLGEPA